MSQSTTLAQDLSATDQSITLAGGTLAVGQIVALDSEYCVVLKKINAVQALIQRGANASVAAAHSAGAVVAIGDPWEFQTGNQFLPPFGESTTVLTANGPESPATFQPGGGGGGGAPANAQYVVMALNATLTQERVLTAGSNITITDGGAGGLVTIASTASGTGDVVGPASATDGAPALFDTTTGKLLKNSTPTGTGNPVLATSPTLTAAALGSSTATTQAAHDNSTKVATTAYVDAAGTAAGYVVGPASATDNALTRFDSTTGKLVQNSTVTLSDTAHFGSAGALEFDSAGFDVESTSFVYMQDQSGESIYMDGGGQVRISSDLILSSGIISAQVTGAASDSYQEITSAIVVTSSADATFELTPFSSVFNVQIGAGYSQTTAPTVRVWGADQGFYGPIGLRTEMLGGQSIVAGNYYNGSPSLAGSYCFAAVTYPNIGPGNDATHQAATTYPVDAGLVIVGKTGTVGSPSTIGFTTGIQIGGAGSNWQVPASFIGTGIDIRDYATRAIYIHAPTGTPTADIEATGTSIFGALTLTSATPSLTTSAGQTNTGYLQVNGKTSGALKITAADATAQTLTLITAAQTSGAASLTIKDQAGVAKTIAWLESPSFTTPALGTPSSGTLTSCTGLPISGLVSSTSTALGVGSLELGDASDTTLTRVSAGLIAVEGKTVATLSGVETFTNTQTFQQIVFTNNAIAASSNAATVPITYRLNTVTNSSAATLTITMTTTSAVDGQLSMVRILDATAAAQTVTWVNTENSTVTAPVLSNGSTTLFLSVGFIYNGGTSKWRCIASA